MVGRSEGFFVLYPLYFEASVTRAKGRRVPAAQAVRGATAKIVFDAAKAAGLSPVLEDEHHHPSAWFERTGRVLVPSSAAGSKGDAIQRVAERLEGAGAGSTDKAGSGEKRAPRGKHIKRKGGRRRR